MLKMDYLSRLTLSHQIHKTGMYSLAWCLYWAEGQIWDEESSSVPGTILTPCIPLSVTCCDSCLTFNTDPSAGNFTGYNSLHKESPASIFGTWLLLLCLMVLNYCLERERANSRSDKQGSWLDEYSQTVPKLLIKHPLPGFLIMREVVTFSSLK